jgi:hypothetical protein
MALGRRAEVTDATMKPVAPRMIGDAHDRIHDEAVLAYLSR